MAAAVMMMIRGVKASKVGAGLMGGNLVKIRPFCTVTRPPAWVGVSAVWATGDSVHRPTLVWKGVGPCKEELDPVALEELADSRRKRKRGGIVQCREAAESEDIKQLAIFGLDQINQRQHTNLELVRVLGAWYRLGPGQKYDITLEATDGGGKGKYYRVGVTDLYMFLGYTKLELVQWVLLDDPYPITFFKSGTYAEYVKDMNVRLKSLCEPLRPPV